MSPIGNPAINNEALQSVLLANGEDPGQALDLAAPGEQALLAKPLVELRPQWSRAPQRGIPVRREAAGLSPVGLELVLVALDELPMPAKVSLRCRREVRVDRSHPHVPVQDLDLGKLKAHQVLRLHL
eukprot:4083652-Lingulodinium_polyedra.AAC.1